MPIPPSPGPFYDAAAAFRARCLAADDSLFTPGRPIWTAATAEDLYVRFVETPDLRQGVGFIAKLESQLEGADPATIQFAAEAVFVHLLGEADTSASTKRSHVATAVSWYPGDLAVPPDLDAALADGIANVGVAKARRDYQLNFLLEFARTWKHLGEDARDDCLADPRGFARFVRKLPPHSASTEIDGLLHKAFPATFEAIFSGNVKRRVVAAFAQVPGVAGEQDVDVALEHLRRAVEPIDERLDSFYSPLIRQIWDEPNPAWDEFVGWAGRLFTWHGFDAQERAYKLEIAARIATARAAFADDGDWTGALAETFSRGDRNLVPWQTSSRFMEWTRSDPPAARALVDTVWNHSDPDLAAFAGRAPTDVLPTLSARLAIASFLLIGVDSARFVIYRPRVYAKAAELVGQPVTAESGEDGVVYEAFLAFLDTLRLRLLASGVATRDRIDAQGLVWWLGGDEPPPADWDDDDRRDFLAYRGNEPPPPTGPEAPEKAWFVRGTVSGRSLVPDWIEGGFISIGWDELGELATEDIGEQHLRDLLTAARPDESVGPAVGNLSRFIRLIAPGHLAVTVEGDDLFVGRVAGAVVWDPDAPLGERRRRDVEWLNADNPLKRSEIRESAPRLYSRLRTLLTVTDLAEDVETIASLVGLADIVIEPPTEVALPPSTDELAERIFLTRQWLDEVLTLLRDKRQVIFYGPPGTGKTYIAQALAAHVVEAGGNAELVQFHPSYAYEDFFEGYRPTGSGEAGGMTFQLRPGPLRQLAADAEADPSRPYLLVVDEINRGNLAKVFGELYFLLEYRDRGIALQYSPEVEFRLPRNLFIVGTMNTADRSIALVDSALRRRFYFVQFTPTQPPFDRVLPGWLARHNLDPEPADLLTELNRALAAEPGIGDEFAIGPSYLMTGDGSPPRLDHVWRYAILPLLEERFFGVKTRTDVEREFGLAAIRRRLQRAVEPMGEDADEYGD